MCDILVAQKDCTISHKVIFAKNSDRPARETQVMYLSPARQGDKNAEIHCSYVSLPDSTPAMATMGSRPYWCWGYEAGINEAGVVGGNAAIFTRSLRTERDSNKPGLTGMDLLRLGLERGNNAQRVTHVIIDLVEQYGQWGSAVLGKDHVDGSYDNSYLIADENEVWVLETLGKRWIAELITEGVRSISNEPTVQTSWSSSSPDIVEYAKQQKWPNAEDEPFDFALVYGDHEHYSRQGSHIRLKRSRTLLESDCGSIDIQSMMGYLGDHYEQTFLDGPQFNQYLPDFQTICMHDSPSAFTWGNTAASLIVELGSKNQPSVLWLSYLPPCSSIFLPFFFGAAIPETVTTPGTAGLNVRTPHDSPVDEYEPSSLWWRLNKLIESVSIKPNERYSFLRHHFDQLQSDVIERFNRFSESALAQDIAAQEKLVRDEVINLLETIDLVEEECSK